MDEPWRPYTKWNTPITKRYILYDSSYEGKWVLKLIEIAVVARGWDRREQGVSVWQDGKVLDMGGYDNCTTVNVLNTTELHI